MKITQVNIPEEVSGRDGLDAIEMKRLGQIVLIAGRNGAGKTRLLSKIVQVGKNRPTREQVAEANKLASTYAQKISQDDQLLVQWENTDYAPDTRPEQRKKNIEELVQRKTQHENAHKRQIEVLTRDSYLTLEGVEGMKVVHFVPKELSLCDPDTVTREDGSNRANSAHALGVSAYHDYALPKIQELHTQYWQATHQHSTLGAVQKERICSEYLNLQAIVSELLGVKLGNDSRGTATLFGFPLGKAKLSDGQKVLIQLAVAIHCQGGALASTILLLDEPENHLHPGAIIEVLEKLVAKIPDGQIWIATHSVAILAHFSERGSLWYMDKGRVSLAGKTQQVVLEGLLGDTTRVQRQLDFLQKPERVAFERYSTECLVPPGVLMTGADDPQVGQIREAVKTLYAAKVAPAKVKLLDYGAGRGRLLANMVADAGSAVSITGALEYIAFDKYAVHRGECEASIAAAYGDAANKWFPDQPSLVAAHNKGSFDVVVMCNVLHEIDPREWSGLFGATGEITELLADSGYLLLVEDHHLPVGEHAHDFGFIVLDTAAVKDLFGINGADAQILADSQRGGRLKAHLIPKAALKKHTMITQRSAFEQHKRHAKTEIGRLRDSGTSGEGKLLAFWTHQYANVSMALDAHPA